MSIETARGIGDDAAAAIDVAIQRLMKRAAFRASAEIAGLDVSANGRLKPSVVNINKINGILDRVSGSLFDDQYLADVATYLKSLNAVSVSYTHLTLPTSDLV